MNSIARNYKPPQNSRPASGNKISTQNSSRAQNHVTIRVGVEMPNRAKKPKYPESSLLKNEQSSNWNTRPYNVQGYQKPPPPLNFQNFQLKSFNLDKENKPPRQKNPSPPPSRGSQNQRSNNLEHLFPKPSILYFAKESYPSYPKDSSPSKKSLPTQSTQSDSTHLPPLSQNSRKPITAYQYDQDKKPVYSPKKTNTVNQQYSALKETDSKVFEKDQSRGRDWTKNQDKVGDPLKNDSSTLQNHSFGLSNNHHQVSGRGTSSDNRSSWEINNQERKEKIVGIRNFSNTCFAGSLLQCLYHLPTFKECLYKCVKDHPSELLKLFEELFRSMDRVNVGDVNSSAFKLILEIFRIRFREFKLGIEGSSEILFRAITEEFSPSSPLVQLFWKGRYSKIVKCQECENQMKITEDIFILHAKDIDYKPERAGDGSLFQAGKGLRYCRKCQIQTSHSTSYEFESLPKVLAIAISDTVDTKSSNKLIPNISVQTNDGKTVQYEYFAGVVNMRKGSVGVHSIAIVKSNVNEGGGYFELNDSIARSLSSLDSVSLYPKLIFYQMINFSSPHKPGTPPPVNNMNYHQRTPTTKIFLHEKKKEQEIVKETSARGRKMEPGRETEGNTHRQKRCVSHDARLSQNVNSSRQDFGKRMALETKPGTSYAGALLQCLYHLPSFKTFFYDYEKKFGEEKEIVSLLAHFFGSMDQTSAEFVNESALEFIKFITETDTFRYTINKDSRKLWEVILQELGSIAFTPFLSLFAARSEVRTSCASCHQVQTSFPQSFTSCTLDEKYYTPEMIDNGTLLTSSKSFKCKCYFTSFARQGAEFVFATFPDILVLNIMPTTRMYQQLSSKIIPKIMLKGSNKTLQAYEYHAGVLTYTREGDGQHSIAVIQCGAGKETYYAFDDNSVVKVNLQNLDYHPRLLFYRKSSEMN